MIGQTISHYKILEELGRGGMGVVYRAHDTKLERDVALKFLPPHLSASEQDKTRFVQEARAAATLDHPNICTIHSIEEHEGPAFPGAPAVKQLFIVMQFVDGEVLRERIKGMSLKQAIEIGIQVAEGLAAAHDKGVVHRDIKPENIMVRKDGIAQIMDFGLAKLKGVSRLTKEGSTVGTAGYMSPEQIQGQDADHRSDIFSLGVLLYEMLTGQLPFKGVHETAIAYEIVNVDAAPPSALNGEIEPELDRIVLECLEKDPAERSQSVKQVAVDLRRIRRTSSRQRMSRTSAISQVSTPGKTPVGGEQAFTSATSLREKLAWGAVALLLCALAYVLSTSEERSGSMQSVVWSSIVLPESIYVHSFGQNLGPPALSADGRAVAFTGVTPDGQRRIYVRFLHEQTCRALPGTEGGFEPFWSPDGKFVGFFDNGKMKKIDLAGGSPTTIATVPNPRGATWNADGTIVFTPDYQSGLFQVSADGTGEPVQMTFLDSVRHEGSHRWPWFLPDGKHFLYLSRTASETGEAEGDAVFIGSVDGTVKKAIVQSSFNAAYANGFLLFARESSLLAQRFDPATLSFEGDPALLEKGILTDVSYNVAVFSVSQNGLLLFQEGKALAGARPMFVDRTGKIVRYIEDRNEQDMPRFSPDGRLLSLYLFDTRSRRSNIWIYDLHTGGRRRLTTRPEGDFYPVWSSDGRSIYFSSGGKSLRDIYVQSISHSGTGTEVFATPGEDIVGDVSPDGKTLLLETSDETLLKGDLWLLSLAEQTSDPVPVQATEFNETSGRFSPNGAWITYVSDESGDPEIYVKNISVSGSEPWKISSGGGVLPVWGTRDDELFYIDGRNRMAMVSLRFTGTRGDVVSVTPLFQMPQFATLYDVAPDGKLFVITRSLETQQFPPLSLVAGWSGPAIRKTELHAE
jgi:serine/threonine protein kinase